MFCVLSVYATSLLFWLWQMDCGWTVYGSLGENVVVVHATACSQNVRMRFQSSKNRFYVNALFYSPGICLFISVLTCL